MLIAIGTSHGLVLVFDHSQELKMVIGNPDEFGGITSIDICAMSNGYWLLTGHQSGQIILWDLNSKKQIKSVRYHFASVESLKFLGDPFRFVASDLNVRLSFLSQKKLQLLTSVLKK
jgi:WD40 repeat protein